MPGTICRTCGFTHLETGCPRWPAREQPASMFDMLTTDQLFNLHTGLFRTHQKLHHRLVSDQYPYPNLIGPLSEDWNIISAACAEVSETMHAVHAEITRRDQEAVNA